MNISDLFSTVTRGATAPFESRTTPITPGAQKVISLQSTGISGPAAAPATDDGSLLKAYRDNPLVRACVDILANSATDPRLIVESRDASGEWAEVVGHPFRQLLIRPNEQMDEAMFFNFAQSSIEVAGIFYCEIVRSAALPIELHPLQPQKVTPEYRTNRDGSSELTHYVFKDGTYTQDIPPDDMLVRDDMSLGGRLSPLASAMRSVDSDNAQTDYVRAFFNNAGVPSGLLKMHGRTIDQAESNKIKSQWQSEYGRHEGLVHGLAVLDENADYERMGANLNELDSATLRGFDEARISMAFGVPPLIIYSYFGLQRATYSNLQEAWSQFWLSTMSARLKWWRSFFTVSLLPAFEEIESVVQEKTRLNWDISEVGALQENADVMADMQRKLFISGGTTVNEFRNGVGMQDHGNTEQGDLNYFELRALATALALPEETGDGEGEAADIGTERDLGDVQATDQTPENDFDGELEDEAGEETGEKSLSQRIKDGRIIVTATKDNPSGYTPEEEAALEEYSDELYALADGARSGKIGKAAFKAELEEKSKTNLIAFFMLGMLLEDGELSEEEMAATDDFIEAAKDAIDPLTEDIFNGRYGGVHAEEEEEGSGGFAILSKRTALWVGAAAACMIRGKTHNREDPELQWQRGATEEPCGDCLAFQGTTMKASLWKQLWNDSKLPQGFGLECGGWNCLCNLVVI